MSITAAVPNCKAALLMTVIRLCQAYHCQLRAKLSATREFTIMKDVLSLLLYQALVILVFKHNSCRADKPREIDFAGNNYEDNFNRASYYEQDNFNGANKFYEAGFAERTKAQKRANHIGREGPGKAENEYDLQNAFVKSRSYGNSRTGDNSEGEGETTNISIMNENGLSNSTFMGSAFSFAPKIIDMSQPSNDNCLCKGASDISFFCITNKDGSNTFSIKYNGIAKFSLEDILKAYLLYFENINSGIHNIIDINKSILNTDNIVFNIDAFKTFDINKIRNSIDTNLLVILDFLKNINQYNIEASSKNDLISQILAMIKHGSKSESTLSTNVNINSKLEALKNIIMEYIVNGKKKDNTNSSKNHNNELQIDVQALLEAIAKAKMTLEAEASAQMKADAESKANMITQVQIKKVQEKAEAESQNTQHQLEAQSKEIAAIKAQMQAQLEAIIQGQKEAKTGMEIKIQGEKQAENQIEAESSIQHIQVFPPVFHHPGKVPGSIFDTGFNFGGQFDAGGSISLGGGGTFGLTGSKTVTMGSTQGKAFTLGGGGIMGMGSGGTMGMGAGGAMGVGAGGGLAVGAGGTMGMGGGGAMGMGAGGALGLSGGQAIEFGRSAPVPSHIDGQNLDNPVYPGRTFYRKGIHNDVNTIPGRDPGFTQYGGPRYV